MDDAKILDGRGSIGRSREKGSATGGGGGEPEEVPWVCSKLLCKQDVQCGTLSLRCSSCCLQCNDHMTIALTMTMDDFSVGTGQDPTAQLREYLTVQQQLCTH